MTQQHNAMCRNANKNMLILFYVYVKNFYNVNSCISVKYKLIRANEFIKLNYICSVIEKLNTKCIEFKNERWKTLSCTLITPHVALILFYICGETTNEHLLFRTNTVRQNQPFSVSRWCKPIPRIDVQTPQKWRRTGRYNPV